MGKLTFYYTAGRLVKSQLRREIKMAAFDCGLTCSVEEDKGFLESILYFTITGDEQDILDFSKAVKQWKP